MPVHCFQKRKMARMQEINKELAKLQQEFGDMLPKAGNEATVWVNDVKELSGLSEAGIAQCKKRRREPWW